ncbi:MAG: hypothetical protein OXU81_02595, partial [Gammaproteobacteria bacterium]|nr:hypothetical protein [Gammaproteobacteria bacterium]
GNRNRHGVVSGPGHKGGRIDGFPRKGHVDVSSTPPRQYQGARTREDSPGPRYAASNWYTCTEGDDIAAIPFAIVDPEWIGAGNEHPLVA